MEFPWAALLACVSNIKGLCLGYVMVFNYAFSGHKLTHMENCALSSQKALTAVDRQFVFHA